MCQVATTFLHKLQVLNTTELDSVLPSGADHHMYFINEMVVEVQPLSACI